MDIIFQSFLMVVMGVIFQYVLMERRFSVKKTFVFLITFVLVIFSINAALFILNDYSLYARVYPLTVHLPVFLLFLYLSKYKGFRLLFNFLTAVFLCTLIALVGSLVSYALHGNTTASIVSRVTVFVPFLLFIIKIFRPLYLQMLRNLKKGWALFCLIPALSYAMMYILGFYPNTSAERIRNIIPIVLAGAIIIAAYGVILIFFAQIRQQLLVQYEQQLLQSQVHALENQLQAVREAEKATAILRHDMRHYTQSIASLLQRDGTAAALEFIGKSNALFEQKTVTRYCEHQTINAILNHYLENAKKQDINVNTRLEIAQNIPVDGTELSAVFSNAIENALHACRKMPIGANKYIELVCVSKPHFLLEITNTFIGEVIFDSTGLPVSQEEGHGIGTRSIEAFAKKNNALLDYKTENGLFRLRILLN